MRGASNRASVKNKALAKECAQKKGGALPEGTGKISGALPLHPAEIQCPPPNWPRLKCGIGFKLSPPESWFPEQIAPWSNRTGWKKKYCPWPVAPDGNQPLKSSPPGVKRDLRQVKPLPRSWPPGREFAPKKSCRYPSTGPLKRVCTQINGPPE